MMPVLREICRAVFNAEVEGKLVVHDLRPWSERLTPMDRVIDKDLQPPKFRS